MATNHACLELAFKRSRRDGSEPSLGAHAGKRLPQTPRPLRRDCAPDIDEKFLDPRIARLRLRPRWSRRSATGGRRLSPSLCRGRVGAGGLAEWPRSGCGPPRSSHGGAGRRSGSPPPSGPHSWKVQAGGSERGGGWGRPSPRRLIWVEPNGSPRHRPAGVARAPACRAQTHKYRSCLVQSLRAQASRPRTSRRNPHKAARDDSESLAPGQRGPRPRRLSTQGAGGLSNGPAAFRARSAGHPQAAAARAP